MAEYPVPTVAKSVEYAPLPGCSRIKCFRNVKAQARRAGGQMEMGWMFWEYIDLCIKSEAHAIWITPQGKRRDMTPQDIYPDRRILFTPDPQVAVKRGYTAVVKTILPLDPLLASVERFDTAFHNLLSKCFTSFGSYIDLPPAELRSIIEETGVPEDIAEYMMELESKKTIMA